MMWAERFGRLMTLSKHGPETFFQKFEKFSRRKHAAMHLADSSPKERQSNAQVVEWQTRMLEVHVPKGVGVQVPS
jgi:hypothetical protein